MTEAGSFHHLYSAPPPLNSPFSSPVGYRRHIEIIQELVLLRSRFKLTFDLSWRTVAGKALLFCAGTFYFCVISLFFFFFPFTTALKEGRFIKSSVKLWWRKWKKNPKQSEIAIRPPCSFPLIRYSPCSQTLIDPFRSLATVDFLGPSGEEKK